MGTAVRAAGLVAVVGVAAALALPFARKGRESALAVSANGTVPAPVIHAGAAAAAVANLASAVSTLTEVEAARRARSPPPPDPSTFVSPTACVRSYVPDVDLVEGSLDFLCEETDAWALERRFYERIAHRPGERARLWTRLGHYGMAAVATMRSGCCVSPEPIRAVMGGLWCGVLRDVLRDFGPVPGPGTVRTFDEIMSCLLERGQRLPERWDHVAVERSRDAFDAFAEIAGGRGRE